MRTKVLLIIIIFTDTNCFSQINKTNIRNEFHYENKDERYEWFIKREIHIKLYDKIDAIKNDSLSYIEFKFTDEIKNNNYGYIYLSNQEEIDSFKYDLNRAIECLSNSKNFESPTRKYKIEVKDIKVKKNTFKTIIIHETLGGNAIVCIDPKGVNDLLKWIKTINL